MKCLVFLLVLFFSQAASSQKTETNNEKSEIKELKKEVPTIDIPIENKTTIDGKPGPMPSWERAEQFAKRFTEFMNTPPDSDHGYSSIWLIAAKAFFFPEQPFLALKAIPDAKDYHGKLLQEYSHHFEAQQNSLKEALPVTFVSLKKGSCKWKDIKSEYNHIPYWSCYKNTLILKDRNGKEISRPMKVLINWGQDWYITHLGK